MPTMLKNVTLGAATACILAALGAQAATAQMYENPYQNNGTDRAGLAIVMKQIDDGLFDSNRNSSTVAPASAAGVLVCGGTGSDATATANSSCIILGDGATGVVNLGQTSDGTQDATTNQTQTNNSGAAEVEEILAGGG